MANKFDAELDRMQSSDPDDAATASPSADGRLSRLQHEIEASKGAGGSGVHCHRDDGDLVIDVSNQPVGTWRAEGDNLVLYRPGSDVAETLASSVAEAAKMSARLIAAASQA